MTSARVTPLARLFLQEDLNFLVTNRIPRRLATRVMARVMRVRSRRFTRLGLWVWRMFASDLSLDEAETTEFASLHECFVRKLKPGARPVASGDHIVVSPCDAEVGEVGVVTRGMVLQAKGSPYAVEELLCNDDLARAHEGGVFVTLRLRSSMYHRFHAPCAARIRRVTHVGGELFNVNPIALARVPRLYCQNERAVVELEPSWAGARLTLVPVGAILVGGIRLHCVPDGLTLAQRGVKRLACDTSVVKGEELGWFDAGSTIVVFASGGLDLAEGIAKGASVRAGVPLLTRIVAVQTNESPGGSP